MILRANHKYIDMSDVGHLLACGEKNADILTFQISQFYHGIDLSECAFIIRGVNSACNLIEQTLRKQIKDGSIFLTWTVDEYFTAVSGVLKLEIRGIKGDELVIKYDLSDIFVRESAVGEGLPQPDMIEKAISEMSEILAKAEEISVKAPIIKNNNWWIFNADTLEYEDTRLPSRGEKGIQGEKGEQGLQGVQGEKGEKGSDGADGFSPVITVSENTETSYKLLITDKNSSFTTPNLKTSGGSVTVDDSLSDSSENPVQNKVISGEISSLWNQMSTLNDLISSIQSGGGNITITTLFDNSDYSAYKDKWSFKNSQWDDRIFSFDETVAKVSSFCDESNGYCMKFSNSFGWNANLSALCSEPVKINSKSVLMIEYNCNSDGDGITPEIIPSADFTSEKSAEFNIIPAFYAVNTFISACFSLLSAPGNGEYYLRLKLSTTNPVFTVKKISVINT